MKSYYLFFAVNEYAEGWPSLNDPVGDLAVLANILEDKYGFQKLDFLKNQHATSGAIFQWISRLATQKILSENTQLFIYFSCYKYPWKSTNQQYWVAHNGEHPLKKVPEKSGLIEAEDIIGAFSNIPCRHILLASDACFFERLTPRLKGMSSPLGEDWVVTAREKLSREIITSSVDIGEFGYSPFARELAEFLSENTEPLLSVEDLIPELKTRADVRSSPEYGILRHGHQYGGSFLFDIAKHVVPQKPHRGRREKKESFLVKCKIVCISLLLLIVYFSTLRLFTVGVIPDVEVNFWGLTGMRGYLAMLIFLAWEFVLAGFFIRRIPWLRKVSSFKCGLGFSILCASTAWLSFVHPDRQMKWLDAESMLAYLGISPFVGGLLRFGADAIPFELSCFFKNRRMFGIIFFVAIIIGVLFVHGPIMLAVEQLISPAMCLTISRIMPIIFVVATLGISWFFASKSIENASLWAVILLQCAYWGAQFGLDIDSLVIFHFFMVLTVMCGVAGLGSTLGSASLLRK